MTEQTQSPTKNYQALEDLLVENIGIDKSWQLLDQILYVLVEHKQENQDCNLMDSYHLIHGLRNVVSTLKVQ